jgi:hypothetical protein
MYASWINDSIRITYSSSTLETTLLRKTTGSIEAPVFVTTFSPLGGVFFDSDVVAGVKYEYYAIRSNNVIRKMECGGEISLVENKGWYVILIDDQIITGITSQFNIFKQNLYTDGYRVKTISVSRNQTPQQIRAILQTIYSELNNELIHVLLLGHVPVPYSGVTGFDVHYDHDGCWATDSYYADLDGIWTDTATVSYPTRVANKNFPGDGKYDQDTIPSAVELIVGRIDMYDLPLMGISETALLNRYFSKNNLFKSGNITVLGRGIECRDSLYEFDEALANYIAPLVGNHNIFIGPYTNIKTQPKLYSIGYGPGSYNICGGIVSTSDYASGNWFSVFTSLIGSYLWDFDNTNSVMRASIFSNGSILSCLGSFDNLQYMGLGNSVGQANRLSQNDFAYTMTNLHGDPSVRVNYPIMPSNLTITPNADTTNVTLNWTASLETDEPLLGYHVYRSTSMDSVLVRLTNEPTNDTYFIDENPLAGKNYYVVKLITLRPSGSGSFYNSSIGLIDSIWAPQSQNVWTVSWDQNLSYCSGDLVNNVNVSLNGNASPELEILLEISDENGLFDQPTYSELIESVDGIIQFNIPELISESTNYRVKLSNTDQLFEPFISDAFQYSDQPIIELNYSLNFDTLRFNILGNLISINSIETGDGSSVSSEDSIYIYAQNGDFIFRINAQNACGSFQSNDTINSTLDTGIITSNYFEKTDQNTVIFYPNPVDEFLIIQANHESVWSIHDLTGRQIETQVENLSGKTKLNTKQLAKGIYIASSMNYPFKSFRFIKE